MSGYAPRAAADSWEIGPGSPAKVSRDATVVQHQHNDQVRIADGAPAVGDHQGVRPWRAASNAGCTCTDTCIATALAVAGTGARPVPVHLQPASADLGLGPGTFPVAEEITPTLLSLPMFPEITSEQVQRVAAAVRDALQD